MEVSGSAMKNIPIPKPPVEISESFESYCSPIFDQQELLEAEVVKLSSIRDYLLPKLMSGEIDVSILKLPTKYSFGEENV